MRTKLIWAFFPQMRREWPVLRGYDLVASGFVTGVHWMSLKFTTTPAGIDGVTPWSGNVAFTPDVFCPASAR